MNILFNARRNRSSCDRRPYGSCFQKTSPSEGLGVARVATERARKPLVLAPEESAGLKYISQPKHKIKVALRCTLLNCNLLILMWRLSALEPLVLAQNEVGF